MTTTPIEQVRQALTERADSVTSDNLLYHGLRPTGERVSATRGNRSMLPRLILPATTVLIVLTLALGVYLITMKRGDNGPMNVASEQIVGHEWRLSRIRPNDASISHDTDYRAELVFYNDGQITGVNGRNAFEGTYIAADGKISVRIFIMGGLGTVRSSATEDAVDSLYVPSTESSRRDRAVESSFTVIAGVLTIQTPTWTLMFDQGDVTSRDRTVPIPSGTKTPSS